MVWMVKNGCGIACIIMAWLLLLFSQYALLTVILLPETDRNKKYFNLILFESLFFLTIYAHLKTIFTDPGSVARKPAPPESMQEISYSPDQVINRCSECCLVKPDRAHHCSVCKRCIRKMDHHCPWVNNCVGERNQKFFVLFTFYVAIISGHALYLSFNHFLHCIDSDWSSKTAGCSILDKSGRPSPHNLLMLGFLIFVSLLFALFATIMLCVQLKAIWSDSTGIENLKKEDRNRNPGCPSIQQVFGSNCLLWLSPFTEPPTEKSLELNAEPSRQMIDNCPLRSPSMQSTIHNSLTMQVQPDGNNHLADQHRRF